LVSFVGERMGIQKHFYAMLRLRHDRFELLNAG
jgi:hypothetical protein